MDGSWRPPPPYGGENSSFRQDAPQNFAIHRKPVPSLPEVNSSQEIRHQRSNQELRSPTHANHPQNLRHQRSFQESHVSPNRGNAPLSRHQEPCLNNQPRFGGQNLQQPQSQRALDASLNLTGRTHTPIARHQSPLDHHIPPVTTHSPRLYHQSPFHGIPSPPSSNTPRIRYQRSYQDLPSDSRPEMQHLRSFRGRGAVPEPEKSEKDELDENLDLPTRPGLSLRTAMSPRFTESEMYASPQSSGIITPYSAESDPALTTTSLPSTAASSPYDEIPPYEVSTSTPTVSKPNAVQNALREVRHFAGGLISHPYETNKHYTMLRHSHGLVFFQGTSTSLAISIFSDGQLPPDRSLWLQNKGLSGKTGMRLKAFLGATGSWLDVTPTMAIESEQLNPSDERAWQRDIAHFRKKAKPAKIREKHILRETVILRIPVEAGDGYFSVVLCTGDKKKNLCTSPTFRLLSTSASMHCVKGASLSTLPLELGAMAVNVYATSKISAVAGPVAKIVQSRVTKYMPSAITREAFEKASTKAYDLSGGKEKVHEKVHALVEKGNNLYEQQLQDSLLPANTIDGPLDEGPQPPYPIHFTCTTLNAPKPSPEAEEEAEPSSLPSITLSGVPDHVTHQIHGHYFAWIREPKEDWQQALLSALPPSSTQLARATFASANKRIHTLRLIDPYSSALGPSSKLTILILGFLRPDDAVLRADILRGLEMNDPAAEQVVLLEEMNDILLAQGVLDHPAWAAEVVEEGRKGAGLKKGYADVKMGVQRGIERVPLHRLGLRSESDRVRGRGRGVAVSGFYVLR